VKLFTAELRRTLPPLYTQEKAEDPVFHAKFFTPDGSWTWYATEGSYINDHGTAMEYWDPERSSPADAVDFLFFGYVMGQFDEWGYFLLSELEGNRGPLGLPIERDLFFQPGPFSQVIAVERRRANPPE
jgi:hypothetical protein